MDLLYYSLIFSFLAIFKCTRNEAILLAILSIVLWCNKEYYNATDNELYYVRSFLAFISANIFMLFKTTTGIYQSVIQLIVLIAYVSLAYDVANNKHILIYNNFEVIIYGLVLCQFAGFFPSVWNCINNWYTDIIANSKYIYRNQKA